MAASEDAMADVASVCQAVNSTFVHLGNTGGDTLRILSLDEDPLVSVDVQALKTKHENGLCAAVGID